MEGGPLRSAPLHCSFKLHSLVGHLASCASTWKQRAARVVALAAGFQWWLCKCQSTLYFGSQMLQYLLPASFHWLKCLFNRLYTLQLWVLWIYYFWCITRHIHIYIYIYIYEQVQKSLTVRGTAALCMVIFLCIGCYFNWKQLQPFIHTFTHRQPSQPSKVTASSSGAVRVSCIAQGHLDTGARDRTSNLSVPSQPAVPPELSYDLACYLFILLSKVQAV